MPKHLYPGFKQTRTPATIRGASAEEGANIEDSEDDEGNVLKLRFAKDVMAFDH